MSTPTRGQATCIRETFGIPSAVVAGAGSGKTDTLTRRIVYALEHPERSGVSDIDNILAITYTNKAAAELKSRIRAALSEAATPENGLALQALKVDGAWISTIHGMCSRILKENALAFGIDPSFVVVADEQVDQLRAMALESALTQMFDAPQSDDEQLLLCEYKREDIENMVEQLVERMLDASGETDAVNFFVTAPVADPFECFMALVSCAQKLVAVVNEREGAGEKVYTYDRNFRDAASVALMHIFASPESEGADRTATAQEIEHATLSRERTTQLRSLPLRKLLALANEIPVLDGRAASAKLELPQFEDVPRTALVRAAAELRLSVGAQFLPALMRLAVGVVGTYTQLKGDAGVLDNNDLMSLVASAFLDPAHADIVQRYAQQFQLVMVDEFQDTNQMQVDMINLVAGGSAGGSTGGSAGGSTGGSVGGSAGELSSKLCVVGDAQQSIYRFRNADLAVFQEHVRRVRNHEQGRVIELADNFRSHSDILSLVRGVFSRVFESDFLDLHHGRDEQRAQAAVPYRGGKVGEDAQLPRRVNVEVFGATRNKSISQRVAAQIARDFKQLCDRGNRPGEMAILLGSMTNADVYAAALRNEGLKCAITGGSVFNKSADVKVVEHLCAALANPYDSAALVAVLTSDLFCLEAGDLLQLVSLRAEKRGALGDIFAALAREENARMRELRRHRAAALLHAAGFEEPSVQLLSAIEILSAAYAQVGARPVSALIEAIFANSGWLDRLGNDDTSRAANVFKAVRMVRDIEQSGAFGARRVAEQVSARIAVAKEAPGVLTAQGDDFVRIMTIHASKGLSIPIVAVAEAELKLHSSGSLALSVRGNRVFLAHNAQESVRGLPTSGVVKRAFDLLKTMDAPFADEAEAAAVLEAGLGLGLGSGSGSGSGTATDAVRFYEALRFLEDAGEIEEHQRKLYVALTRAKEALIVTQKTIPDKQKARACGGMHVNEALADLLMGDAKDASFTKAKTFVQQVITLPDLDAASDAASWEVRLQVFPAEDAQKAATEEPSAQAPTEAAQAGGAFAEQPAEGTEADAPTQLPAGAYPTTPLLLYDQGYPIRTLTGERPYSPRWASGIVSASALAAAADEDGGRAPEAKETLEGDTPTCTSNVSEGEQLLASRAAHAAAQDGAPSFADEASRAEAAFVSFPLAFGEDDEPPAPAPERGSAFHALCEWAVRHRGGTNTFPMPPQERIAAIARFYGLNARQESELSLLLERWFASLQATAACAHRYVRPEAAFWVSLGGETAPTSPASPPVSGSSFTLAALDTPAPSATPASPTTPPLVLEGFIDLLAYDTPGAGAAYVIDYKTGTRYNTPEKRRAAYELQAACYAYALMMQGFEEVTLDFVFVDQLDFEHGNTLVVERFPEKGTPPYTLLSLREYILRSVQ